MNRLALTFALPLLGLCAMSCSPEPVAEPDPQANQENQENQKDSQVVIGTYTKDGYNYIPAASFKAKLDAKLGELEGDQPVVVVCPRGGGGTKRCYDHLAATGIAKDRLLILEKGQAEWSYEEYTKKQ